MKKNYNYRLLLKDLENGIIVPFVGAGFSKNAEIPTDTIMPDWNQLGIIVKREMPDCSAENPIEIFSLFEEKFGREKLIKLISEAVPDNISPGRVHNIFIDIFSKIIYTTNYDRLIEKTFENKGIEYCAILTQDDFYKRSLNHPEIYKIHGDFSNYNEMVVTKNDYSLIKRNKKWMFNKATIDFASFPILFIGYSLNDKDIKSTLELVKRTWTNSSVKMYIIQFNANNNEIEHMTKRGLRVINIIDNKNDYPSCMYHFLEKLKKDYIKRIQKVNIPEKNEYFTGREEELKTIADNFRKGKSVQLIIGMPGLGKTQLSIEYAHANKNKYRGIFLFNAETEQLFISSIIETMEPSHCKYENKNLDEILWYFKIWTQENPNCLFIIDNANDDKLVSKFIANASFNCNNIIVTSRDYTMCVQNVNCFYMELDVLSDKDAEKYLEKRVILTRKPEITSEEVNNIKEVCSLLGNLPLALEQASNYIFQNDVTIKKYISLYKKNNTELSKRGYTSNQISTYTTFKLSLDKIKDKHGLSILYFLSYMIADNINLNILLVDNPYLNESLRITLSDEIKINDILLELRKQSLIKGTVENIRVHRLIQDYIRNSLNNQKDIIDATILYFTDVLNNSDYSIVYKYENLKLFLANAKSIAEKFKINDIQKIDYYISIAYGSYCLAQYDSSQSFCEDALPFCQSLPEKKAKIYRIIANIKSDMGDQEESIRLFKCTLSILNDGNVKNPQELAGVYNDMGVSYIRMGDSEENLKLAKECYDSALILQTGCLESNHHDIIVTYNNIASLYARKKEYDEALRLYKQIMRSYKKTIEKDGIDEDLRIATIYNNIGKTYHYMKEYDKAIRYFQKSLKIRIRVLDEKHNDLSVLYGNMGDTYYYLKKFDLSIDFYYKAKRFLNPDTYADSIEIINKKIKHVESKMNN